MAKNHACALNPLLSFCSEHAREEIKFYCEDCEEFTCPKCVEASARHHSHSYKTLDSYQGDILFSLEPVQNQLSTTSNAAKQIDTQCTVICDQQASVEARLDQTIKQLHVMLDNRKEELKSRLHYLANSKLNSLATQKDQIMKTHTQLKQFQSEIHEKLRLLRDDREIVAMKQSVTTQVSELTSTFQTAETMKPVTSADIELTMSDNLPELCRNYGALLADELLPDPSKCFIMDTGNKSTTVANPNEIDVKVIDHFGNPCIDILPPLKFELIFEVGGPVKLDQCTESPCHYEVTFTPTNKGQHLLHVTIDGRHIAGSPCAIHVKSSIENLGGVISRIDGVSRPWGIVVNKKREIIVSESNKHCISVYSVNGSKLRSFGSQGSREGQFKSPRGLALDDLGNIVVVDHDNHRIQMFTEDGQFLKAVGSKGSGELQFNGPNTITFNAQNCR